MARRRRPSAPLGLACALAALPALAQGVPARWSALSTTALAITGDATFSRGRITFGNGASLALRPVSPPPGFAVRADGASGRHLVDLYRVVPPRDPVLLRGNRLCGGAGHPQPVTFLATWQSLAPGGGTWLTLAAFSGAAVPTGEDGACATYGYVSR